jgi:hypothetical protein
VDYFKPKSFVLSLRNAVIDKYSVERISFEPLTYKVISSGESFASLFFEIAANGKVGVALNFSDDADENFVRDLSKHIETLLESVDYE